MWLFAFGIYAISSNIAPKLRDCVPIVSALRMFELVVRPYIYCRGGSCSIFHCSWTASLTSRGPGSLRRCPSHLYLRFLIASTRSYVCLYLLASSWADLPVNLDRHLAFAPLIRACVRGVNLTNGLSRDPLQHSDVTIVTPLRIEHD